MSFIINNQNQIVDIAGRTQTNTLYGELMVAGRTPEISLQFQYNISTYQIILTEENGGTAVQDDSMAILSSGTNVNGRVSIRSRSGIRYRPGYECEVGFAAVFTLPASTNSFQRIGVFSSADGVYLGIIDNEFAIGRRKGGTDFITKKSDFNLDKLDGTGPSGLDLDPTKMNMFRISYGWYGISPIVYEVYSGFTKGYIPFHVIDLINLQDVPTMGNPVLPLNIEVEKDDAGSENIQMRLAAIRGGIIGPGDGVSERVFVRAGQRSNVGTTLTNIITFRSNETFQSKTNLVRSYISRIGFVKETGNQAGYLDVRRNPNFGTTLTYQNHNANNSVMSYSTTSSSITGGTLLESIALVEIDSKLVLEEEYIEILPGDVLAFGVRVSNSNADFSTIINWRELF